MRIPEYNVNKTKTRPNTLILVHVLGPEEEGVMAVGCGALIGLMIGISLGGALTLFLPSPISGIVTLLCIIGGAILGPKVMNEKAQPQSPEEQTEDDLSDRG